MWNEAYLDDLLSTPSPALIADFEKLDGDILILGACIDQFGYPQYGVHRLIRWQAQWILQGGRLLNKPTHFE